MNRKHIPSPVLLVSLTALLVLASASTAGLGESVGSDGAGAESGRAEREFTLDQQEAIDTANRLGGAVAVVEGAPISEQLKAAFGHLDRQRVPTGILLEAGSVLFRHVVLGHSGLESPTAPALDYSAFGNAYFDLVRSTLETELPTTAELDALGQAAKIEHEATPIVLAVIEYNSIDESKLAATDFVEGRFVPSTDGPISPTRRFVASAAFSQGVRGAEPMFVVPSELVITNGVDASSIGNLMIHFDGGSAQSIELDRPFSLAIDQLGHDEEINYTLTFQIPEEGTRLTTRGTVRTIGTTTHHGHCYDMPHVHSTVPFFVENPIEGFSSPMATLGFRILPSSGTVNGSSSSTNMDGCHTGGKPELECALVVLPGFEELETSSFNEIEAAFGDSLERFGELGYDVVLVDYANSRNYIQRNGLAFRQFLVNVLPNWMAEDNSCVAVVSASMGTQVARYAMTTAEQVGEDHNVGLSVNLDGPFQGSNIPIGLQAGIDFLAPVVDSLQDVLPILDSPAARQLLIKNRLTNEQGSPTVYYVPKPEHTEYFNEVDLLGLPSQSRNVSIVNGSGTGSMQNDGSTAVLLSAEIGGTVSFLFWDFWVGLRALARTDHVGNVFESVVSVLFFEQSFSVSLESADFIDLAPGGHSDLHQSLAESISEPLDIIEISTGLDHFDFVPTSSAQAADFDATFSHKCNTEHVRGSSGVAKAYIGRELAAFINDTMPPTPIQYVNQCGELEPGEPGPPTASCKASPTHGTGSVNVTFDASGSLEPDSPIVSYHWNFGDHNATGSGEITSHTYFNGTDSLQIHAPTLTVTDSYGKSDSAACPSIEVMCVPPQNQPEACMQ